MVDETVSYKKLTEYPVMLVGIIVTGMFILSGFGYMSINTFLVMLYIVTSVVIICAILRVVLEYRG